MIEAEDVNVRDLALYRPNRSGPGNDEVGPPVLLASGLAAIYQPMTERMRDAQGREFIVKARFFLDGYDVQGNPLDVRPFDHVQFTDWRKVLQKRQQIVAVNTHFACDVIDHLELRIGA